MLGELSLEILQALTAAVLAIEQLPGPPVSEVLPQDFIDMKCRSTSFASFVSALRIFQQPANVLGHLYTLSSLDAGSRY